MPCFLVSALGAFLRSGDAVSRINLINPLHNSLEVSRKEKRAYKSAEFKILEAGRRPAIFRF